MNEEDIKNELKTLTKNGYNLKLKSVPQPSWDMKSRLAKGYYPEVFIDFCLSEKTPEGKRLRELFDQCKVYEKHIEIKYINEREYDNLCFDSDRNEMVNTELTDEKSFDYALKSIANARGFKGFISRKEVRKFYRYGKKGKTDYVIDLGKLNESGFRIDMTNAAGTIQQAADDMNKLRYEELDWSADKFTDSLTLEDHAALAGYYDYTE